MSHHTLPPGRYYIGDPCYVFSDKTWDELISKCDVQDGEIMSFGGADFWSHSTAWGNGMYKDGNSVEYGVDSGLLGAVPIGLIDNPAGETDGLVIDAPDGLHVEYDSGTFWFGAIVIKTDDYDEDLDGGYYDEDPEEIF